jgi:uncharacterized membrane protein YkvA (DUF1232 family)
MAAREAKQCMRSLLMFLPRLVALCGRLITDRRVPQVEKALFVAAVLYAIIPFDFIPDFVPFVGQVDDVYLISLTLLRLISQTNESIVREHWHGGGDVAQLAASVVSIAPLILPQRVRRVLTSRVGLAPKEDRHRLNRKSGNRPTLIELASEEEL